MCGLQQVIEDGPVRRLKSVGTGDLDQLRRLREADEVGEL